MDTLQKKAGSTMDGEKPHLLPVSVAVAKKALAARRDAVRLVSAWTLFNTCLFAFCYAIYYAFEHDILHCNQSPSFLRCRQPTDAEESVEGAFWIGMLCCAASQAAAAVLALRLPCRRRRRRALAYLALALTIGGHCMVVAEDRINLGGDPGPGDLFSSIGLDMDIFVFAAGDILSLRALLVGGPGLRTGQTTTIESASSV